MTFGEYPYYGLCPCGCRPWQIHTWPTTDTAPSTFSLSQREAFKTWRKAMKFAAKLDCAGKPRVAREDGQWTVRWTPRYWTTNSGVVA